MKVDITFDVLKEIYRHYNPLGQKHTYFVDDFLIWSRDEGDFYWIWEGAVEISNGKGDPKDVIKNLPFANFPSDYKDLLIEAWLQFINNDPKLKESIWEEYQLLNLPF